MLIRNLQASPQHNGREGVVHAFEPSAGRYLVSLEGGGTLGVRAANLIQSLGIEVVDLQGRPELNGRIGRIVGTDEPRGRYHVSVQGQVMSIPTGNALLPVGTHARVVGLQNDSWWNGSTGRVTGIDRAARRYVVEMDPAHSLRVKWDSLVL